MSIAPTETWDLASVFPGGPGGDAFNREADALAAALTTLTTLADALPHEPDAEDFARTLLELFSLSERLDQFATYAVCAGAEDATVHGCVGRGCNT